jgi:hypothetical protein
MPNVNLLFMSTPDFPALVVMKYLWAMLGKMAEMLALKCVWIEKIVPRLNSRPSLKTLPWGKTTALFLKLVLCLERKKT